MRQWRKFLCQVNNKTSLIVFLVNEWKKEAYTEMLQRQILYTTVNDKYHRISAEGNHGVPALQCSQEEADGRLLLHADHAAREGYQSVVICSEDTDVFIMCLGFHDVIGTKLFQKCGTTTRMRVLDIEKIAASVGRDVCKALIGMHAYTGCDSVSAFAAKGKTKPFKILTSNVDVQQTFCELGSNWDVSPELMNKLEAFTCLLYSPKASVMNINALRYHLFCVKNGEIESHQLPPCRDCLAKHAERANYQAAVWRRCLEQDPRHQVQSVKAGNLKKTMV